MHTHTISVLHSVCLHRVSCTEQTRCVQSERLFHHSSILAFWCIEDAAGEEVCHSLGHTCSSEKLYVSIPSKRVVDWSASASCRAICCTWQSRHCTPSITRAGTSAGFMWGAHSGVCAKTKTIEQVSETAKRTKLQCQDLGSYVYFQASTYLMSALASSIAR